MVEIPDGFPDVLLSALPAELVPAERALIEAPELVRFWCDLSAHLPTMAAAGWDRRNAAGTLVGAVTTPPRMGYDAHGTLARRVRQGVNMERRKKAADLARELAALLDEIGREPLPPDAAIAVAALLHKRLIARDAPSYFIGESLSALLKRLADALAERPDYAAVPGLASQKASWRGFIRGVRDNLADVDFILRERDAVTLASVICRSAGIQEPSRDSVRAAMRDGPG